jgi:hypothetical protein
MKVITWVSFFIPRNHFLDARNEASLAAIEILDHLAHRFRQEHIRCRRIFFHQIERIFIISRRSGSAGTAASSGVAVRRLRQQLRCAADQLCDDRVVLEQGNPGRKHMRRDRAPGSLLFSMYRSTWCGGLIKISTGTPLKNFARAAGMVRRWMTYRSISELRSGSAAQYAPGGNHAGRVIM